MRKDPIIEEIRKIREAHAAKFNYDIHAIVEDIKKNEEKLAKEGWRLVSLEDMNQKSKKTPKSRKKGKK